MQADKLKDILSKHKLWLAGEDGGERANLSGADLSGADLRRANLSGADLSGADLRRANLSWTDLRGADLSEANLRGADLRGANLRGANLSEANLSEADLRGANLSWANLSEAKKDEKTRWPDFQIPQEGSMIVWKKLSGKHIAKLKIPAKAKRTASLRGRKCRAEYVKVLAIYDKDGNPANAFISPKASHYALPGGQVYKVGAKVYPDKYDPDPKVECTSGIHFFLTREEAENWN